VTIKVIGAGFGRTGTMSLQAGLEELGFKKCHHMTQIKKSRKGLKLWYEVSQGKPVNWDDLFEGYQATVDWPACTFYKELVQHYPNAKVVLTVREPERWYDSTRSTIFVSSRIYPRWMRLLIPKLRRFEIVDRIIWKDTFHGRFTDKQHAIRVFNQHIEEVKKTILPEKLLIYEVKQGWEPLCEFLDVPIPQDKPFPHFNDKSEYPKRIKQRQRIVKLVYTTIFGILTLISWWWLRTE